MPSYLQNPLLFLLETLLGFYLLLHLLRLLFQLAGVSYFNPFVQFVAKTTRPTVAPLRRLLPRLGRLDLAALLATFLLALGKEWLVLKFQGSSVSLATIAALASLELVDLLFAVYIYGILAYALLSWFPIGYGHPLVQLLEELFEPFLEPFRRLLPPIGGLDLSPLLALVGLEALRRFLLPLLQELLFRTLLL